MAGMGGTGTINITQAMMDAAIQAIDDYQTSISALNSSLSDVITNLIPTNFSGSAASGFQSFYSTSIAENVGTNLSSMLESLRTVCDSVKAQIPGDDQGVDDQLGQGNQSAGSAEAN